MTYMGGRESAVAPDSKGLFDWAGFVSHVDSDVVISGIDPKITQEQRTHNKEELKVTVVKVLESITRKDPKNTMMFQSPTGKNFQKY